MADRDPERYMNWRQAQPLFGGISRTTAWRQVKAGELPAPVRLSPGRSAWALSEILAWQASRSAERAQPRAV